MKITRDAAALEVLDLLYDFQYVLEHQGAHIYIENPTKLLLSYQIRFRRVCAFFASMNIQINDLKHFYDLEFIEQFKDYQFAEEILRTVETAIQKFYTIEDIKPENLREIIRSIIYFRKRYLDLMRGFFGGARLMGRIPVEERVSTRFVSDSIKEADTVVEKLNTVITYLFFPQIKEFDVELLIKNNNFPIEDYKAIAKQEWDDYYDGN
ncbi:hypothetical protein ACVVIH_15860 [Chryseobacterium arthrosphaerae]|uniref:hypothetical protein n=1 Tax=Chryseobacterium arthrosphaerae TaxID=651561 RepID=UPI001BAFAE33|nr:hypothetical protein [Chryseobacterium arthrosphaerae]QUY55205.1 hypothetical protein I2F65_20450 [Chryseobacterium arthrosphaerae]